MTRPSDFAHGLGLDSPALRLRMVQRLRSAGLGCAPVWSAMQIVERHGFVESALVAQAYEDTALPIGAGQTISKPSVVARMLALLFDGDLARNAQRRDGPGARLGRVLEIGTGCGYQAALLAQLARDVVSIERIRTLHELAAERLAPWRGDRVRLVYGDGRLGHAPRAPYDAIVAAAGGDAIPPAWLDQLAVGGRLVAPSAARAGAPQQLVVIDRDASGYRRQAFEFVQFVPLESGAL